MKCVSRKQDQKWLVDELKTKEYGGLLHSLHGSEPFFRRFKSWGCVLKFMREGSSQDHRKDEVLRPIFTAHAVDSDPKWRSILMAIFWPGLEGIHAQKRYWDEDGDEMWQNLIWVFLRVICRLNVNRRPERIVQKVYNDTVHDLHYEYKRQWKRSAREQVMPPTELDVLAGGVEGIDFDAIDLCERQEIKIESLRIHVTSKRISESDFLLIVGTRIYGKSVADYAREKGLKYQTAKKRRQRAESVIRRFESDQE